MRISDWSSDVCSSDLQAESVVKLPAAAVDPAIRASRATAIVAGGCFWGVEGVFSHVKGVIAVEAGYHVGRKATARYDTTGSGTTSHADSMRNTNDHRDVSNGTLLSLLFSVVHEPTVTKRRVPPDLPQNPAPILAP